MSTRPALPKREVKKDFNINQKKGNRSLPRELFKFKYLRFKCRDPVRTIDFYKSCGMNLDFDGDLVSFKQAPPPTQQKGGGKAPAPTTPTSATMESNHMKKAAKEDSEQEEEKPAVDLGGPMGRVFGLSYPPTGGGAAALLNRIQLVFEEDKEYMIDSKFKAENEKANDATTSDQPPVKKPEKKNIRQYEYLVIYVHFITRLVKRMVSKGFDLSLDITQFDNVNNIKMAILKDPNNIEIRLIEMPDNYMNESGHQKQWFARLGYYTIPTSLADKTVMLYESLFQVRVAKPPPNNQKAKDAAVASTQSEKDEAPTAVNIRKIGPSQMVKNAMTKGAGFRIVDMDEMVVGLMDSVFYWMGNDMRTANCCVCFTEVSNADTGEAITCYEKYFSPLIAIGFEVPNLDTVVSKLKHETKDSLTWDSFRYKMSKTGMYARFDDSINGIYLDLLCTKLEQTVVAGGKAGKDRQQNNKAVKVSKEAAEAKEENGYAINMNHLKGHARVFSEGSINLIKGYGWELRKDAPIVVPTEEQEKANKKDKKMLSMFRDENGGEGEKTGSQEDLTPGVPKRKLKQVLGRVREAEIAIIENLLNREKSKSF